MFKILPRRVKRTKKLPVAENPMRLYIYTVRDKLEYVMNDLIAQAAATVATGLREVLGRNQIERLAVVPVLPSKTPGHADYEDRLTRALRMGCAGFNSDIRLHFCRSSSTESDHRTGDRLTPEALHSLLELNSAAVAVKPLREAIPATVPIIGLFVARRILRNPSDDFENHWLMDSWLKKSSGRGGLSIKLCISWIISSHPIRMILS